MRVLLIGGIFGLPEAVQARRSAAPETVLASSLRARGVEIGTCPHRMRPASGKWDIVHVHHFGRQLLPNVVGLPRREGLVITRHQTGPLPRGWRGALMRMALHRADAIVALSDAEADELQFVAPPDRVHVIPNGIDSDAWPYTPREAPTNEPWRLLVVGQLIPMKRVDLVLDAAAVLRRHFRIEVRLAYHNDELEEVLRRQASSLGLEKELRFLGFKDRDGLRDEYTNAHLLILASDTGEALPSVITEAMLTGLPVVARAVGGIAEQLDGFGTLLEADRSADLAATLRSVMENYDAALTRARCGAASARERYGIAAMGDGHLRLYRELLAR